MDLFSSYSAKFHCFYQCHNCVKLCLSEHPVFHCQNYGLLFYDVILLRHRRVNTSCLFLWKHVLRYFFWPGRCGKQYITMWTILTNVKVVEKWRQNKMAASCRSKNKKYTKLQCFQNTVVSGKEVTFILTSWHHQWSIQGTTLVLSAVWRHDT